MRPVSMILGFLTWRVGVLRMGYMLRLRNLASSLVVLGGVGAAIGFAVVGRLLGDTEAEDDDEAETRPDAE
jgi:hypothetical protein